MKIKSITMLIAFALCLTIGGVYATWSYAGTDDIADAYYESKVTITDTLYDATVLGGKIVPDGFTIDKQEDNAAISGSKTAYAGYQTNAVADGKVDVRFIGTVDSRSYKEVGLDSPGQGIAFSLPVDDVVGLTH